MISDRTQALATLLAPYADPDPDMTGRLIDVPPEVATQALGLVLPDRATGRLNLTQPPQVWLVEQAAELDGRLVGSRWRGFVRFDGVEVPAAQTRRLAERIAETFPATPGHPAALDSAVAEAWLVRHALDPAWTGIGTDLLTAELPNGIEIIGLWWD